jgi:putative transposase
MDGRKKRKRGNLPRSIYVPGASYFITTAVRARAPFFENANLSYIFLRDLTFNSVIKAFHVQALSILPDHVHLVIKIGRFSTSRIMQSVKLNTAKDINKVVRPTDEFRWQRSFYDHLVRDEEDFDRIVSYIIDNPVKHEAEGYVWVMRRDIMKPVNKELLNAYKNIRVIITALSEAKQHHALDEALKTYVFELFQLSEEEKEAVENTDRLVTSSS